MVAVSKSKVPITVLTGFLGAGKTTVLNQLLAQESMAGSAVIVNEFGAISIDAELIVGVDEDVLQINNGCICCTVRSDLVSTISDLLARRPDIRRILIETTGLADPAPVIQSFIIDETLSASTQLDAIVTVVDPAHIERWLADTSSDENVAAEQIAFADVVVISKVDLVGDAQLAKCRASIRAINPMVKIVQAANGVVDPLSIVDVRAFDLKNCLAIEPLLLSDLEHEHDAGIVSVEVRQETPLDGAAFLRTKGILSIAGEARRWVFHGVHMTLEGRPGRPWSPAEKRSSAIVFIGRGLDAEKIREQIAAMSASRSLVA